MASVTSCLCLCHRPIRAFGARFQSQSRAQEQDQRLRAGAPTLPFMTQELLRGKYQYRRRLPHYQKADRALFVTFCCGCLDPLPVSVRDIVLRHCLHDQGTKAAIHAVVVMPDHAHLLLTPLQGSDGSIYSLVEILQGIKSASAHSLNRVLGRSGPVWQEESFDHVLRSVESFEKKVEYIRQNPVRRGLVSRPDEYRWLWIG